MMASASASGPVTSARPAAGSKAARDSTNSAGGQSADAFSQLLGASVGSGREDPRAATAARPDFAPDTPADAQLAAAATAATDGASQADTVSADPADAAADGAFTKASAAAPKPDASPDDTRTALLAAALAAREATDQAAAPQSSGRGAPAPSGGDTHAATALATAVAAAQDPAAGEDSAGPVTEKAATGRRGDGKDCGRDSLPGLPADAGAAQLAWWLTATGETPVATRVAGNADGAVATAQSPAYGPEGRTAWAPALHATSVELQALGATVLAPAVPETAQPQNTVQGTQPSADPAALASLVRTASMLGGAGAPERAISVPVSDAGWQRAIAGQVQWMASANVQSATLRLTPEHLGPVEVRVDLQASQINVSFVAAHPDTRSALEQSLPTLRAMLAHGGLTLGQAHVQSETRSGSHFAAPAARSSTPAETAEVAPPAVAVLSGTGLVDEYA